MLGVDELTQKRWLQETAKEEAAERSRRSLAKHLESNQVTVEADAGRDVSSVEGQMGKARTALDVIGRLKKCNSRLEFVKHPLYDLYGIYLRDQKAPKLDFKGARPNFNGIHICGMESGINPEFTIIYKKKIKVPDKDLLNNPEPTNEVKWKEIETYADQKRGWRTVLIRLLHAGLITEYHVQKHFGWAPSKDSAKWSEMTK
jgi:hypothetical protein